MKYVLSCALGLVVPLTTSLPAAAPPASPSPARVEVLLRQLDDDNFFTRLRADNSLRAMGKPVLPLLRAERERTTSLEVRERLDRMLRDLTFDEQVPNLVRLLSHANTQFRDQAEGVLLRASTSIVPLLKKELKGESNAEGRARLERIIAELSGQRRPITPATASR